MSETLPADVEAEEFDVDAEVEPEPLPEEDVTFSNAPVKNIIPIIRVGDWARIKGTAQKVPAHARGRDVVVTAAPVKRAGADSISPVNYEYQPLDTVFTVALRDTREEFDVTRGAFAAWGPDRHMLDEALKAEGK